MITDIAQRLEDLRERIAKVCREHEREPSSVELLAVSKTRDAEAVQRAIAAGQVSFGENRVQELLVKSAAFCESPPRWHMIGSLQTNKARDLIGVPHLDLLHSLDRHKLATTLESCLAETGRSLGVLLQIHATHEESKHGCPPEEAEMLARYVTNECPHLRLRGLMAMGPREGDPTLAFGRVAKLRRELQQRLGRELPVLSLGMTGDLEVAIAAGSTMVRVGTAIFGPRDPR